MLAKVYPYLLMFAEAAFVGIGAAYATYSATHDLRASIVAGVSASVAKLLPTQVTPSPAPKV